MKETMCVSVEAPLISKVTSFSTQAIVSISPHSLKGFERRKNPATTATTAPAV